MKHGGAYAALAAAGGLWGTGFVFGKIALRELPVEHMVLYRFLWACTGLLPIALARWRPIRGRDWAWVLLAGSAGVPIQFLIQFAGLDLTSVSHASLVVGTMPVLLAVAAAFLPGERLNRHDWLAIGASTVGVGLVVVSGGSTAAADAGPRWLAGDMLVLVSMVAAVGWILCSKRLMARYDPLFISALIVVAGTALLAAWTIGTRGVPPVHLSRETWIALAAQGLLATTCTTLLWNWGLARVPAARAGVFVNLEPIVGAGLGILVLGDTAGPVLYAGGALIVASAAAITRAP